MNTTNPYAPPRSVVQDIAVSDLVILAGRGARLVAFILDGIIAVVLIYVPLVISTYFNERTPDFNPHPYYGAMVGRGSWLPLLGFGVWAWLTVMFVARNGQSIGKKIIGIKVVRTDGSKASLGRIFWLRNVLSAAFNSLSVLVLVPPLYGIVDTLFIFGSTRQCVHDKIADTIVVEA
jgi:uncharacterized RDD family membrane protein YckC